MTAIAEKNGKLDRLIHQFEAKVNANPKDLQTLELLAQLYTLTDNTDKTKKITEQLLTASPNDPVYQAIRLRQTMQDDLNYETFKKHLDELTGLTPEARYQYIVQYTKTLYRRGKKADAEKLLDELKSIQVPDLSSGVMLVDVLVLMDKMDEAEKVLAQLAVSRQPSAVSQRLLIKRTPLADSRQPVANSQFVKAYQNPCGRLPASGEN